MRKIRFQKLELKAEDAKKCDWSDHKRKVKYGPTTSTTECLVPNSKKFSCRINVHQIPDGVCQIHENSSVLEKILRASRAFTSSDGSIIGCAI